MQTELPEPWSCSHVSPDTVSPCDLSAAGLALGIVPLWTGALFGIKAQPVQSSATKAMTSGFPLRNASSADEQDAALNRQPPERELASALPLHGRRSSLKLLQYLKLLPHRVTSWRKEPVEHGNVHPLPLNVLTCPQPQSILHPFDAVHNTPRVLMCSQPGASHQGDRVPLREGGWWCYVAQCPAQLRRQLPPLEPFLGPFAGGSCTHL